MPSFGPDGRRRGGRVTSQPRRPARAQGGGRDQRYRSARNYRTIRGTDTGYNLRHSKMSFGGRQGGLISQVLSDPVLAIGLIIGVVVIVALIFGVSSCVRGCASNRDNARAEEENAQDARVAAGVSEDLTTRLTAALNRNDMMSAIAANASDYDERLIELALREPEAVSFVAAYPSMQHDATSYSGNVVKGQFTQLFTWDKRWGAVDFAGAPLAVTGSGPTALSMAYMGLTGKADRTPADIAQTIADATGTDEALGMSASFLTSKQASDLGLTIERLEPSADALSTAMQAGTVVMAQLKAGSEFGESAHWMLVVTENADGTLSAFDPISTLAGRGPWAATTIATASDGLYSIRSANTTGDATSEEEALIDVDSKSDGEQG